MALKKKFGQHFLKHSLHAEQVANALQAWGHDYEYLIEIGPGGGALTTHLVKLVKGRELTLFEIDDDLIEPLIEAYGQIRGVHIEHKDFLDANLSGFNGDFGVCGNFPYNISSQIVFKVLEQKDKVPEMVGMFQKEVAQRIAAAEGNKQYGILSVLVQAYYQVEILFYLSPNDFNPPPKVESAVIRCSRFRHKIEGVSYEKLRALCKAAFGKRRKTLRNALKGNFAEEKVDKLDKSILQSRAEQLSVAEFIELAKMLE